MNSGLICTCNTINYFRFKLDLGMTEAKILAVINYSDCYLLIGLEW